MAVVNGLEVLGEHQRDDRHELHEDVQGRSRRVLQRVTHRVAYNGRLQRAEGNREGQREVKERILAPCKTNCDKTVSCTEANINKRYKR